MNLPVNMFKRNNRLILMVLLWLVTGAMMMCAIDLIAAEDVLGVWQKMFVFYAIWSVGFLHRL
jgi:hypothetical protein